MSEAAAVWRRGSRVTPSGLRAASVQRFDRGIDGGSPGVRLHLRNKRRPQSGAFGPERTVLMVHGSTFATDAVFDFACDGFSWMDYLAARGFDAYAVDIAGYGLSTTPTETAGGGGPVSDTEAALADVSAAINAILELRTIPRLCLLGWSWGTTLMGAVAVRRPGVVERLVLYAPQWLSPRPSANDDGAPLRSCRIVEERVLRRRRTADFARGGPSRFLPEPRFEAWLDAAFGPRRRDQDRRFLAPTGALADTRRYWNAGQPFYEPGQIRAPVLVVHGADDQDLPSDITFEYFHRLTGASDRMWVELGDGGHDMFMEMGRLRLFEAVHAFLRA